MKNKKIHASKPPPKPAFAKGDRLKHASNDVGIATGEATYEKGQERSKIILKGGASITDYAGKFKHATAKDKEKS
jgi:hypothetical protein